MKGFVRGRFAFACFRKVWFENNLHRSIIKVLYCAIGFFKETNELRKIRTGPPGLRAVAGRGLSVDFPCMAADLGINVWGTSPPF